MAYDPHWVRLRSEPEALLENAKIQLTAMRDLLKERVEAKTLNKYWADPENNKPLRERDRLISIYLMQMERHLIDAAQSNGKPVFWENIGTDLNEIQNIIGMSIGEFRNELYASALSKKKPEDAPFIDLVISIAHRWNEEPGFRLVPHQNFNQDMIKTLEDHYKNCQANAYQYSWVKNVAYVLAFGSVFAALGATLALSLASNKVLLDQDGQQNSFKMPCRTPAP